MMKWIVASVYVVVLVCLGAATFVENAHGTPFVHQHIYGTWWFAAMWGALAAVGTAYIIMCRERRPAVLLLHFAFLTILGGALLSHVFGRSGKIHLRQGEPQSIVAVEHCGETYMHVLQSPITLHSFQLVKDEEGRVVDYRSVFDIDGSIGEVSMNKIHRHDAVRFYQAAYDSDQCGSTLLFNRDPLGIPVTYVGYVMLIVAFVAICLRAKVAMRSWWIYLLLTVLWYVYYFVLDGSWTHIPVLRSPLLFVHVVVIILSYAMLLVQAVRSAVWLLRSHHKGADGVDAQMLKLSLALLATGIFLGAVWANISWGNYWTWDSKEVWALITLMVYAVPVHRASLPAFRRPRVWHGYMLCAFATVLMTYFGVSYFLTGLHAYN